jgi:hypothetical protein
LDTILFVMQRQLTDSKAAQIRALLVGTALAWQDYFGVAPQITNAISELDAALLVGMTEDEYCAGGELRTAVTRGKDFVHGGLRYQATANRPSGKKGSDPTIVSLKKKFEWDRLIWLLYNREYVLQEAWEFTVEEYRSRFAESTRLSPGHMRLGKCLFNASSQQ